MQPTRVEKTSLYEQDFVLWLEAQAAAVREGRWSDLDAANVVEELEGLAGSDRQQIANRLRVLMIHFLKMDAQPDRRTRSWQSTINTQAARISIVIESSPSLRGTLPAALRKQYPKARKAAATETGRPITAFPPEPTPEFEARVLNRIAEDLD